MRLFQIIALIAFVALTGTIVSAQSTAQISGSARDQSGAVLPGVEVSLTQTNTGLVRTVVTNETGSYSIPNLPVGPYKLEASLPGFRTFIQTGIVLQVGGNPVINITLEIGQVSENVQVQADAALVETRNTGVGQVIDNVRVLELPLNGRQVTELIILSGGAVGGGAQITNRAWPTDAISVSGGLSSGLVYRLDGGTHNDPYGNLSLPLPFPDALQEFKVETSAVPAQYGGHSGGAVNAVTKSGTNEFHGDLFEFVRNKVFNARNAFATERDGLKRNQFGGVLGGPIVRNKLFFFGGHQITLQRSQPTEFTAYVPTLQMLAGDWTAVASPACNQGRQITLRAPFQDNRINPDLFSKPAVELTKRNPITNDPCGAVAFGRRSNSNDTMTVGKVDYQHSNNHSIFGRYELGRLDQLNDYDGKNWFSLSQGDFIRRAHSFVLGDTYSISPNMVSAFRGTVLRTVNNRTVTAHLFNFSDLGVKNLWYPANYPKFVGISIQGAITVSGMISPNTTNMTIYHFAEDMSWVRGRHQIGFGGEFLHQNMNYTNTGNVPGNFSFNGQNTGLSMGDLMLGKPNSYVQSAIATQYMRQNSMGVYIQDTWKATSKLTVNGGIRWEPGLWPLDTRARAARFDKTWFDQNLHSTVFKNAPAGLLFYGDRPDVPQTFSKSQWLHFAPRFGLAYDPKGDGLTVIRAAYGLFYDYPPFNNYGSTPTTPPRTFQVNIPQPAGGFEDPWQGYPGGNPFPPVIDANVSFPTGATYTMIPVEMKSQRMNQWNLSVQHQIGNDWLISGNYVGNNVIHILLPQQINPAIYMPGASCVIAGRTYTPCSSTSNLNQRRILALQNPDQGQYYGAVGIVGDGATRSYNGMMLSVQRRRVKGVTIQGNYTWSHCIDDGFINVAGSQDAIPERRGLERANCELDRRHNFNMSSVYETPQFANNTLRLLGGGWRISGIVRMLSGAQLTVTTGLTSLGIAPDSTDEKPRQILASPYAENRSINQWLNPAAFATPVLGQYGPLIRKANVTGPGMIRIDLGVVRVFKIREKQSIEFRAEAFNAPNHVNPGNPSTTLTDSNFGRILTAADPRIMQMAMKFVF